MITFPTMTCPPSLRTAQSPAWKLFLLRLPKYQRAILRLNPASVAALSTLEEAFEMLLLPISATTDARDGPIVVVIDALDEADPVEQLQPGWKGGVLAGGNQVGSETMSCPQPS